MKLTKVQKIAIAAVSLVLIVGIVILAVKLSSSNRNRADEGEKYGSNAGSDSLVDLDKLTEEASTEVVTETEAATEAVVEEKTSVMLAKLQALGEEIGYCTMGEFGADKYDKIPNETGSCEAYLKSNYAETGILTAKIDSFFSDSEAMIVFVNKEDGIYAQLYVEKDGAAELAAEKSLNVTFGDVKLGTQTEDGCDVYAANDKEYMFKIVKSGDKVKLVIYSKTVAYDTDSHKITVYDINESGIEFVYSAMMSPALIFSPDFGDDCGIHIISYDADNKYIDNEERKTNYHGDEGVAAFNEHLAEVGIADEVKVADNFWQLHQERKWDYYVITAEEADLYIGAYQENRYTEDIMFPHNPKLVLGDNSTDLAGNAWWRAGANEDKPEEKPAAGAEGDRTPASFDEQDARYAGFFANEYAALADELMISQNGIPAKYTYYDLDCDGVFELLIGDGAGVFAVVSEKDGAFTVKDIYGWENHFGPSVAEYIGNGCFTSGGYYGNNYGGDFTDSYLWKYVNQEVGCRELAKMGGMWNMNTPSDELPTSCWTLYTVVDETIPRVDGDYSGDPNYIRDYVDYGSYMNRETQEYENDVTAKFNVLVEENKGTDSLAGIEWKDLD